MGSFTNVASMSACQQKCDETPGCGAVSWKHVHCHLTSSVAFSETSNPTWKCMAKRVFGKYEFGPFSINENEKIENH